MAVVECPTENMWLSFKTDEHPVGNIASYCSWEFLDKGGFGTVEMAHHRESGDKVVVKILQLTKTKSRMDDVSSEIRILRRVKAHTAQLREICRDWNDPATENHVYIVMEYGGHNIYNTIRSVPVQSTMRGILQAVSYLHRNHIAHLDLKPGNILIDDHGAVKIIDFGLAAELRPDSGEAPLSVSRGTQGYKAPEMILGPHPNLKAADMWSVGSVLVKMLITPQRGRYYLTLSCTLTTAVYLDAVVKLCGAIDEQSLPGCASLPQYKTYKEVIKAVEDRHHPGITTLEEFAHTVLVNLIRRLLVLDPAKRITANEALEHKVFALPDDSPDVQRKQIVEPGCSKPNSGPQAMIPEELHSPIPQCSANLGKNEFSLFS